MTFSACNATLDFVWRLSALNSGPSVMVTGCANRVDCWCPARHESLVSLGAENRHCRLTDRTRHDLLPTLADQEHFELRTSSCNSMTSMLRCRHDTVIPRCRHRRYLQRRKHACGAPSLSRVALEGRFSQT